MLVGCDRLKTEIVVLFSRHPLATTHALASDKGIVLATEVFRYYTVLVVQT